MVPEHDLGSDQAGDRGAVTVEGAIALAVVTTVFALFLAGFFAVTAHLRCVDAAREAARLVARGEPDRAREAAAKIAPSGADVRVATDGDQINVEVSLEPVGDLLPDLAITGTAFAVAEPEAVG
ncbi:pilus assembly protein [Kibdelosporangium philippinense]|uniref:Pilus assembly protein n=1 Tax=Kibdelosporangium philippinense TaxID=211113 RepID=A0ABS8ZTZ8_9PSEU|nr:TadE family type IV pilus minor pilin [Kibdelosporangium philippinense]MCE7009297.1 pilus assembly protein [Kibdelosporangium philippinense]